MSELKERYEEVAGTPPRPSQIRIAEAYLMIAEAGYRPGAPGDGFGAIQLSDEELEDDDILIEEAIRYADKFSNEESTTQFRIGVSNYRTNRAFVMCIEAARRLAAGDDGKLASRLLELSLRELRSPSP